MVYLPFGPILTGAMSYRLAHPGRIFKLNLTPLRLQAKQASQTRLGFGTGRVCRAGSGPFGRTRVQNAWRVRWGSYLRGCTGGDMASQAVTEPRTVKYATRRNLSVRARLGKDIRYIRMQEAYRID